MSERSLRAITGCCEKCGTTLQRLRLTITSVSGEETRTPFRMACPRCDVPSLNNDWSIAANWTSSSVPSTRDMVRFDAPRRRSR